MAEEMRGDRVAMGRTGVLAILLESLYAANGA